MRWHWLSYFYKCLYITNTASWTHIINVKHCLFPHNSCSWDTGTSTSFAVQQWTISTRRLIDQPCSCWLLLVLLMSLGWRCLVTLPFGSPTINHGEWIAILVVRGRPQCMESVTTGYRRGRKRSPSARQCYGQKLLLIVVMLIGRLMRVFCQQYIKLL